ncbi:hypothetical protein SAMN05428949_0459 [Chitinophaga sp. YR627]|uniref:hypothetical protein n=1 Tax=Chitinophaga sp. YR627 TaxID=1881041 RepID=UPI0008EAC45B|nr:hypothetical protein [Chitinophaga sp. YR627]SFM69451.1 hypothetical protein SAMN05428949_0459 [Chitinophaga sp. YR627]
MRKYFLLIAAIVLTFAACTKESGVGGGTNNPGDSTSTPGNGSGSNGGSGGKTADSVVTFTDLKFSLTPGNESYGRAFSSFKGKVFPDKEIPDTMGKYVDIFFNNFGANYMFFASANDATVDLKIPGTLTTLVRNYVPIDTFDVNAFDTIMHASTLKKLTVKTDDQSFATADLPLVVFFQNGFGKKGIIKVKAMSTDYVIADVKVTY